MSQESIKNPHTSDTTFAPKLNDKYKFGEEEFKGICLKQDSISFLSKKVVNLYISYQLDTWWKDLNTDFAVDSCLFEAVNVTKNADPDKCKYNGCGIGFNLCSQFLWTDGSMGKNVIIFEVDNNSSVDIDGRNKNLLVLGEEPTQDLDNATITAEAIYPINFIESGKRFVLSLHYNGRKSFSFVNAVKMYQFKAKDSEIKP